MPMPMVACACGGGEMAGVGGGQAGNSMDRRHAQLTRGTDTPKVLHVAKIWRDNE